MILLRCFGGTTILGNTQIYLRTTFGSPNAIFHRWSFQKGEHYFRRHRLNPKLSRVATSFNGQLDLQGLWYNVNPGLINPYSDY